MFWYLRSQDGEYTLHGPHIVERFLAPGQDASTWQVLIWLVSVSDQSVFGAAQEDTAKLLQELTVIDDFFYNGGVVLTTEAEAEACYLGTRLQRGPMEVKAVVVAGEGAVSPRACLKLSC